MGESDGGKRRGVVNTHTRQFEVPLEQVCALVATLSSKEDQLWPSERWPRMRLDQGLNVGSSGGHGPVGYFVEHLEAEPVREVIFRFTKPRGFDGTHAFTVTQDGRLTTLRHDLRMRTRGWARLTWSLFFRPLHDALIEEAFDKATGQFGLPLTTPHRRSLWVRILYRLARAA